MLPALLLLSFIAQATGVPSDPAYEAYARCVRENDVGAEQCRQLREAHVRVLRQRFAAQYSKRANAQAKEAMTRIDADFVAARSSLKQRLDSCSDCGLPIFSFGTENIDVAKTSGKPN